MGTLKNNQLDTNQFRTIFNQFCQLSMNKEQITEVNQEILHRLSKKVGNYSEIRESFRISLGDDLKRIVAAFYLKFGLYEAWFSLFQIYGYSNNFYHHLEDIYKLRKAYESDVNKSYTMQFQILVSSIPQKERSLHRNLYGFVNISRLSLVFR